MSRYKSQAIDILEEYASSYSEMDAIRLAKRLEQNEKDTAKDILRLAKENNNGYEGDMDRFEKAISERYGVGGDHEKQES